MKTLSVYTLAVTLLLASVLTQALPQNYPSQRHIYQPFVDMKASTCGDYFFRGPDLGQQLSHAAQGWAALIAAGEVYGSFIATPDGLTDTWCDNYEEMKAGLSWEGDCDNFAFTMATALNNAGIYRSEIFLMTVKPWLSLSTANNHKGHPSQREATHIITVAWVNGAYFAFDNLQSGPVLLDDLVGNGLDYIAVGWINMGNYGEGKDNDVSQGFAGVWN